jgi:hypothetical protein
MLKKREELEKLVIDSMKCTLQKLYGNVWTGDIWLKISTGVKI